MREELSKEYLDFAIDTAHQAGRLTLAYFQAGIQADYKEDDSPVTIADKKAEELIRERITARYPDHDILGEEFGGDASSGASHRWLIDPIDGTKSFIRGVPLYGVLLGLEIDGRCEIGVAYFPAVNEMVYAARGLGCYLNGRRASVADTQTLSRGFVSCADVATFAPHGRDAAWQRIKDASYYRVGWCDSYGHMLVATGRLELMMDPIMNPWDCGPFPVILREAGGYFGDWSGNETNYGNEAISTTRTLLPEVLKLIEGA